MITLEKLEEILEKIKKEDGVEMIEYGEEREPEFIPDYYEGYSTTPIDLYIISFLVKREEEEEEDK